MLHVVPFPVCCSIWNECSWPGSLQFLGPVLFVGPILLLPLPLFLLHAFLMLLVGRSESSPVVDLYQLLPPSEMAGYQLPPSEMAGYQLQSIAPSELAAYLSHLPAPSELAACWKQLPVLLEPGVPLDEAIGGALLRPRLGGSQLCR